MLDALRQHDARTRHGAIRDHHLTKTDPNSNLGADIVTDFAVENGAFCLERQGCTNGIRRASEFRDKRITPYLMGDAIVSVDGRREAVERILNSFMGNTFISLNECRRANHISVENDG